MSLLASAVVTQDHCQVLTFKGRGKFEGREFCTFGSKFKFVSIVSCNNGLGVTVLGVVFGNPKSKVKLKFPCKERKLCLVSLLPSFFLSFQGILTANHNFL